MHNCEATNISKLVLSLWLNCQWHGELHIFYRPYSALNRVFQWARTRVSEKDYLGPA